MEKAPINPIGKENKNESFSWTDIEEVETARGSTYRYLPDGTTQRFKKVENKEYAPQSALVYVPNYEWVKAHASKEMLQKLGENDGMYTQTLLEYAQLKGKKAYIVDQSGKKLETNQEIAALGGPIYLALTTGDKTDFFLPVFHTPKTSFMTFDTRKYLDEETNEMMRENHLGNAVVRISLKEK